MQTNRSFLDVKATSKGQVSYFVDPQPGTLMALVTISGDFRLVRVDRSLDQSNEEYYDLFVRLATESKYNRPIEFLDSGELYIDVSDPLHTYFYLDDTLLAVMTRTYMPNGTLVDLSVNGVPCTYFIAIMHYTTGYDHVCCSALAKDLAFLGIEESISQNQTTHGLDAEN